MAKPAYQRVAVEIAQQHRRAAQRVVDRAVARGELSPRATRTDDVLDSAIECLYGTVIVKVLAHGLGQSLEGDASSGRPQPRSTFSFR